MGQHWPRIPDEVRRFIEKQPLFFVATAPAEGRVNLSPKGIDSFRVLGPDAVAYLDLTGSGNETAAHVTENGRITFMFCAMAGPPRIIRLYGQARIIAPGDAEWPDLRALFPEHPGTRQIFLAAIDRASTSCGWGIPVYELQGPRATLTEWSEKLGSEKLAAYRAKSNTRSIDGLPTGLKPAPADA